MINKIKFKINFLFFIDLNPIYYIMKLKMNIKLLFNKGRQNRH